VVEVFVGYLRFDFVGYILSVHSPFFVNAHTMLFSVFVFFFYIYSFAQTIINSTRVISLDITNFFRMMPAVELIRPYLLLDGINYQWAYNLRVGGGRLALCQWYCKRTFRSAPFSMEEGATSGLASGNFLN
jgi:ABC-type maltose transport system permease subunit